MLSAIKGIDFNDKGEHSCCMMASIHVRREGCARSCTCMRSCAWQRVDQKCACSGIVLISDLLRSGLNADCSVLMGANVANEMASDAFCETTIGYKVHSDALPRLAASFHMHACMYRVHVARMSCSLHASAA